MTKQPLFAGLVFDEGNQPVATKTIGDEAFYIVNDAGFNRHIPAIEVDKRVLDLIKEQLAGHEDILSDQAAKMLGQEDPFSQAVILNQLKNIGKQFDMLLNTGIPEGGRAYMGMIGFRIIINVHGEIVRFEQPSAPVDDELH